MTTVIKTKNSVTASTTPSSLVQGELAVNITDKKMWVGDASSVPQLIVSPATAQVYPGSGLAVSTGSAWGTSKTTPTGDVVGTTDTQTLTNKTITYADNTLTGVVGTTATQTLTNKTITGLKQTKTTSSSNNFDLSAGNFFTHTLSGNTTFTVSNTASSGSVSAFVLNLTNGGSATITWWSGMKWAGGTAPTLTSSGLDALGFFTYDGGTTWYGLVLSKDLK